MDRYEYKLKLDEMKAKLTEQPWYLERVDDSFDSTYCDIYAKIKSPKIS